MFSLMNGFLIFPEVAASEFLIYFLKSVTIFFIVPFSCDTGLASMERYCPLPIFDGSAPAMGRKASIVNRSLWDLDILVSLRLDSSSSDSEKILLVCMSEKTSDFSTHCKAASLPMTCETAPLISPLGRGEYDQ